MAGNSTRKQGGPGRPFQPGQSGNPKGKPPGARNHATRAAQALIDGKAQEVVEKALELALSGDGPLLKAILDRLCPPRKDGPIKLSLPALETASDLPGVTGAVLDAVAKGELTPGEAQSIAALVEGHRRAIETADLAERVAKLERRSGS